MRLAAVIMFSASAFLGSTVFADSSDVCSCDTSKPGYTCTVEQVKLCCAKNGTQLAHDPIPAGEKGGGGMIFYCNDTGQSCQDLADKYDTAADKLSDTKDTKSKDDVSNLNDANQKLADAQSKATSSESEAMDALNKVSSDHRAALAKALKDNQSNSQSIAASLIKAQNDLADEQSAVAPAQSALNQANSALAAVAAANTAAMVRLKCIADVQSKFSGHTQSIIGGASGLTSASSNVSAEWSLCISKAMADSQNAIAKANIEVANMQSNIDKLNAQIKATNAQITQLKAAQTQAVQQQTTDANNEATDYSQNLKSATTKYQAAVSNGNNQVQVAKQAIQTAQSQMMQDAGPSASQSKTLSGIIARIKAHSSPPCCGDGSDGKPAGLLGDDSVYCQDADNSADNGSDMNPAVMSQFSSMMNQQTQPYNTYGTPGVGR